MLYNDYKQFANIFTIYMNLTFNSFSNTDFVLIAIYNIFKKAVTRTISSAVDQNFIKILNNGLVKDENEWI